MLADINMGLRFARGLTRFLATPIDPDAIDEPIRASLAGRGASFLWLLEHAVFRQPASPYLPLLNAAGVELGDVAGLVEREGVEATLERLYRVGVWMSLDEFKGRRPLRRPGVDRSLSSSDFDNPLTAGDFRLSSSGSRGPRRRMIVDLDLLASEARVELVVAREGLDGFHRPAAMWRPVPPGSAGLKSALRRAKQGRPLRRWFTQQPVSFRHGNARHTLLTVLTAGTSLTMDSAVPWPRYVPLDEAWRVAAWLADQKALGEPALLDANISSTVRVCQAASERGLDISGSSFRMGGEPFTPGKARVIADAGCQGFVYYSMAELGRIGLACSAPDALDDVHFLEDKLGLIHRPRSNALGGPESLFFTTLHPASPKIMLNVESGDSALVTRRRCGCGLEALGFGRHLQHIRSHDKLTSEGMHFVGDDLLNIIDAVLPAKFGGNPTDYQFVEREEDGLTKVDMIVSPRLGQLDEGQIRAAVLDSLAAVGPAQAMMVNRWRVGGTLRVHRRHPYATATSKILALHDSGQAS